MTSERRHETYRERDLPLYVGAGLLSEAAVQAQSVATAWAVFSLSNSPLALGLAGIVQLVPMLLLTLPAGEVSDRLSPRRVLAAGLALQGLCAAAFVVLAMSPPAVLWPWYGVMLGSAAARAFAEPAGHALLPLLVPPGRLPHAIAWSSSAWQLAGISGPALGGVAFGLGAAGPFGFCAGGFFVALLGVLALGGRRREGPVAGAGALRERLARMIDGLAFVWSRPVVLGALSLDLFVVMLGGATSLIPIFARDILHAGPAALGLLRSAPAAGACIVALFQTRHPPVQRVGSQLFGAVAVFGAATLVFAFSTSLAVSLAALLVVGASDMVSVNIRGSLVQLATPDAMRGRVSAVSTLFIGASNELATFESGVAAALLGAMPAVALGGLGTLAVAALWMRLFPALIRADRIQCAAVAGTGGEG